MNDFRTSQLWTRIPTQLMQPVNGYRETPALPMPYAIQVVGPMTDALSLQASNAQLIRAILGKELAQAELHVASENRTYENWKRLQLAVGIIAVLTVALLCVRLGMGAVNLVDLVTGATLIFECGAAVVVTNQVKVAKASVASATRVYKELQKRVSAMPG